MRKNGVPVPQLRYFWLALLARTFEEADGRHKCGVDTQEEAQDWLLNEGDEFEIVCELAGLDGEVVRKEARRRWMPSLSVLPTHQS